MFEFFVQPSGQATLHHHDQLAQLKKIQSRNRKTKADQPGNTQVNQKCDSDKTQIKKLNTSGFINAKTVSWIMLSPTLSRIGSLVWY